MLVRLLQLRKASSPMLVTLSGIVMVVSALQYQKANNPILVTLSGIVMLVRLLQPKKALSPMLVALWALVLANRLKMRQVTAMVAPYPTMAEVNKRAAGAYFSPRLFESRMVKRAVGLVQRWLP